MLGTRLVRGGRRAHTQAARAAQHLIAHGAERGQHSQSETCMSRICPASSQGACPQVLQVLCPSPRLALFGHHPKFWVDK